MFVVYIVTFNLNYDFPAFKIHIFCSAQGKVGIPNFVSGPREYIMEGAWVELLWQSWWDKSDIG